MPKLPDTPIVDAVKVKHVVAIVKPGKNTLRHYGMTEGEWVDIVVAQGRCCAICLRVPKSGRLMIDHEHVPKWKRMTRTEKRKYVRGIICSMCNGKCVNKHVTLERAVAVVRYLREYARRRPK